MQIADPLLEEPATQQQVVVVWATLVQVEEICVLSFWVPIICSVWEQKREVEWHPLRSWIGDFLRPTTTLLKPR